jgi:imidazolonepropionase-like amidohydrolase
MSASTADQDAVEGDLIACKDGRICHVGAERDAPPSLDALIAEGATTIEIKSEYGLTLAAEMTVLQRAGELVYRLGLNTQHARIWRGQ